MQFGYNCKNYLPWYEKCSLLIDERKKQKELLETKWISIKEALIYSSLLKFDLLDFIEKKKIKVKKTGKRKVSIGIEAAWQYDECPLAHYGGQCMYFTAHNNMQINCLAEINSINEKHPNTPMIPDEGEVKLFEKQLIENITQESSKKSGKELF